MLCFFYSFSLWSLVLTEKSRTESTKTRVLEKLLSSIIEPTESEGLETNVAELINRMKKMIINTKN